jgi:glycosyltransferase involved in cell wall biosynthesis
MKIGVIIDNELNNDKRVLREIEILKENGYEIFILCFAFENKTYDAIDNTRITRINIRKSIKNILFFILNTLPAYEWLWSFHIKRLIKQYDIDVLHVHDLYMARAAKQGIRRSGKNIPMILDLHENYPFAVTSYNWTKGLFRSFISRPEVWQQKEKEYLSYADKIIVLSEDFSELLISRYPELDTKEFIAFPNVPDVEQWNLITSETVIIPFKKTSPILFYFGVIAERRGIFKALEVFSELVRENYSLTFLLIGPVDKKDRNRFFNLIKSERLSDRIEYIPWIDISELKAYLEICDICIAPFEKNPQHESGVANKIYDYMSGRKAIIASDCGPQQKLIEKYNCGIIYSNNTEMKEALIKLLMDENLRRKLGMNGYSAVIEHFNINKVKEKLLAVYKKTEEETK